MSYRLETTRRFEKDFRKLASELKHRLDKEVRLLETQPYSGKRLRGEFEGSLGTLRLSREVSHPWCLCLEALEHRCRFGRSERA